MSVLVVTMTSVDAFLLVHLSGDPAAAMAGEGASPADVEAVRHLYGFDRPLFTQYLEWLGRVLGGDFGRSFYLLLEVSPLLDRKSFVKGKRGSERFNSGGRRIY